MGRIHPRNCDLCEYGDYEPCHGRMCCKIVEDETLEIGGDDWDFIKRMGCGTFEPVRVGNPRQYPKNNRNI